MRSDPDDSTRACGPGQIFKQENLDLESINC